MFLSAIIFCWPSVRHLGLLLGNNEIRSWCNGWEADTQWSIQSCFQLVPRLWCCDSRNVLCLIVAKHVCLWYCCIQTWLVTEIIHFDLIWLIIEHHFVKINENSEGFFFLVLNLDFISAFAIYLYSVHFIADVTQCCCACLWIGCRWQHMDKGWSTRQGSLWDSKYAYLKKNIVRLIKYLNTLVSPVLFCGILNYQNWYCSSREA